MQHPESYAVFSMVRPVSRLAVRLAFWKGLDEGLVTSAAARVAGVSRATAYRWLGEDRQVLPSPLQDFAVTRPGSLSLREQVVSMLTERFSPEQVAGRPRLEHPKDVEMQVSHETIYQALYVQGRGSLRLEVG